MRPGSSHNVVMIVDDDMFIRKILRSAVQGVANVIEIGDGAEVKQAYLLNKPDIVFLDIHLPNKEGIDILKEIRETDKDAHIVMVSADATLANVAKVQEYGVQGFLAKPFNNQRIIEHLLNCPTIIFKD